MNEQECLKQGGIWAGRTCLPREASSLDKLTFDAFCNLFGERLPNISNFFEVSRKGIFTELSPKLCGFNAIHVNNGRGTTKWLPDIENLDDEDGWGIEGLCRSAVSCSKGDVHEVLDLDSEREAFAENFDLKGKKRARFMKGEILEQEFDNFLTGSLEFSCEDVWDRINKLDKHSWMGDWGGDERDFYDLGEREWLIADEDSFGREVKREDSSDFDFEEHNFTSPPTLNPPRIDDKFSSLVNEAVDWDLRTFEREEEYIIRFDEDKLTLQKGVRLR